MIRRLSTPGGADDPGWLRKLHPEFMPCLGTLRQIEGPGIKGRFKYHAEKLGIGADTIAGFVAEVLRHCPFDQLVDLLTEYENAHRSSSSCGSVGKGGTAPKRLQDVTNRLHDAEVLLKAKGKFLEDENEGLRKEKAGLRNSLDAIRKLTEATGGQGVGS